MSGTKAAATSTEQLTLDVETKPQSFAPLIADEKFVRHARNYAVKLIVDWDVRQRPDPADASDEEMADAFKGCARVAWPELYPSIRAIARQLFDSGEIRSGIEQPEDAS